VNAGPGTYFCGDYPNGLVEANGLLYGTTPGGGGGSCDCGEVFSINPKSGAETIVYSFCSQADCTDGARPAGDLLNVNGTLYGVTEYGGSGACPTGTLVGCGTVFAITP
jgi:uncharacterized repeat protein (TIGR03803 family)